jgi:hypothetical protein
VLERDQERRPRVVVGEDLTPAEIPESITLGRDEAFDILEGLEAGAERAWIAGDLDRAVAYDRLAAIILRALGAEERL